MKNSDIVACFLKEQKIKVVFGIIGSANSHIFNSIAELNYTKIINVHHEQAAVMAMGAYYRSSGKLSATIVTAGAGASNAITGVISNWADSIPGIIISGNESTYHIKEHRNLRMYGTQGFNITKMVSDVTKYSVLIDDKNNIQEELEKCLSISISGRPGPTWIDIPFNIQSQETKFRKWNVFNHQKTTINKKIFKNIINDINQAKCPLVLGGHGIRLADAKKEFNDFVDSTKLPTTLSWSAIDLLPSLNKNFYGRFGLYGQRASNFIVQNCDLLIVIGSRLALPQTGYNLSSFARNAKIIIVDIDSLQMPKNLVYKHLKVDCKEFLIGLNEHKQEIKSIEKQWINYCQKIRREYPWEEFEYNDKQYINSYRFIRELSKKTKEDQIIVTDMGTALLSGHQSILLKKNQKMFTSLGLGEMGYGLPGAIGASFANPDKEILCLNCDGGIMMNLQELHTIIENGLNIKIVIFNNDGYLMIKHTQKMLFKGNYNSVNKNTGIGLPNFEKILSAFGFDYFDLRMTSNVDAKIDSFLSNQGPAVLEVFMDPEQEFIPKVKGKLLKDKTILSLPIEDMSPVLSKTKMKDAMLIPLDEKSKQLRQ